MTTCPNTGDKPGYPYRRLLTEYRYVLALNIACALIATFLFGDSRPFRYNFADAMCIGTLAYLFIYGTRLALWRGSERPHWAATTAIIIVAVPLAQFIGLSISRWIMYGRAPTLDYLDSFNPVVTLLFTAGAAYFFNSRGRIARLQASAADERARTEALARQAMQAQLQMLQAQIEPHMLFNTLANLQGLIAIDPPRAQLLLDHLIQYLRATLGSSRAEHTTLGREFDLMQSYLQVMAVRMDKRLTFSVELPEELRALPVSPMLLQPLVENAIAHGVEPKIEGGHIAIGAVRDGDALRLTVSDTGLGLDHPDQPGHGTRMALTNIRARLQALHGERASFALTAGQPCGAVATVVLPLEEA